MSNTLPRLLSADQLHAQLDNAAITLVDLSKPAVFSQAHIPGAVALDFRRTQIGTPPAPGDLPAIHTTQALLAQLGIDDTTHVIAYDDEGGGWASRFLWLLESVGHTHYSLLDGGIHAWIAAGFDTDAGHPTPDAIDERELDYQPHTRVNRDWLLQHYQDDNIRLWDARSEEEYTGVRAYAVQAGHIPGAIQYEWTRLMDPQNKLRIRPLEQIREELAALGIDGEHAIITYCQSHHRSALAWFVGTLLGLDIRAYPGSWAEWGNLNDSPCENTAHV